MQRTATVVGAAIAFGTFAAASAWAIPAMGSLATTHAGVVAILPVASGQTVIVKQGNDQGDHVGLSQYAFDFAVGQQNFVIVAADSGTIIGLNDSSDIQCSGLNWESAPVSRYLSSCWAYANFVLIKNDNGPDASLYMHLLQGSTCSGQICVHVGEHVSQGEPIGRAGTTGWSTGVHLHFQMETAPVPQQNPHSGWWFTTSVPTRFSNPEVLAQDSGGIPLTGQKFLLGGSRQHTQAPVDWSNRTYGLTCNGIVKTPVPVTFTGGTATATGPGIGRYSKWELRIARLRSGILPPLGRITVVLFDCGPQPSNFSVQELDVFHSAGGGLISLLPPAGRHGGVLPGVYVSGTLTIGSDTIGINAMFYGPGDTHASGPSIPGHVTWRWTAGHFTESSSTRATPSARCSSAVLTTAVEAQINQPGGLKVVSFACESGYAFAAINPVTGGMAFVAILQQQGQAWRVLYSGEGLCLPPGQHQSMCQGYKQPIPIALLESLMRQAGYLR